jgi:transposase
MPEFRLRLADRHRIESELKQLSDAASFRRRIALLELDRGRNVTEVAQILHVTRQAIYNWIGAFRSHGHPDPHPLAGSSLNASAMMGRPNLFTQEMEDLLEAVLEYSPRDLGYQSTTWTVPLLLKHLRAVEGVEPSESTLRRQLKKMEQSWKRGRYTLRPDPQLAKKSGLFATK